MNNNVQGILGLGPNNNKDTSFLSSIYEAGLIPDNILSFSLGTIQGSKEEDSYMIFGGINYSQISGDLNYFDLKNTNWWALDM